MTGGAKQQSCGKEWVVAGGWEERGARKAEKRLTSAGDCENTGAKDGVSRSHKYLA